MLFNKRFIVLLFLFNCTNSAKDNSTTLANIEGKLTGVWVDLSNRSDTLDFDSMGFPNVMLKRGQDTIGSTKNSKSGYGFYRYQVTGDSISFLWCFASKIAPAKKYFFNAGRDTLLVGNFFDRNNLDQPVLFIKVR